MTSGWQNRRSRSEMSCACRVSSAMSLSQIPCRPNVACDIWATSCNRRGMGRTASFVTDCNRSFEASVRYPPDRCGQWADALADCGCTDRLIWAAPGRLADRFSRRPMIGLCLYELLDQRLRPLFWVAVAPAVISVAPVGAVRDPRTAGSANSSPATGWAPPRACTRAPAPRSCSQACGPAWPGRATDGFRCWSPAPSRSRSPLPCQPSSAPLGNPMSDRPAGSDPASCAK